MSEKEKKPSDKDKKHKDKSDKTSRDKTHESSSKLSANSSKGDRRKSGDKNEKTGDKTASGSSSSLKESRSKSSTPNSSSAKLSNMFDSPSGSSTPTNSSRPSSGSSTPKTPTSPTSTPTSQTTPLGRGSPAVSRGAPIGNEMSPQGGRGRGIDRNAGGRPQQMSALQMKKMQVAGRPGVVDSSFMTIKMDHNSKMRMADEQLQAKNKHMQDILQVIKLAKISENEFWEGHASVMPIFKHFGKELKLASDIYSPNNVKFHFPATEEFVGLEPKVYKIDRTMPIQMVVHNVLHRNGLGQLSGAYTLATLSGLVVMPDNHALFTYGLGSLFQDWELKIVAKPHDHVKENKFATLNRAKMSDEVKSSVLIVNAFQGAPTKLQRLLLPATFKVSQMIKSITERLNLEVKEKKFQESKLQLQDLEGNALNPDFELVAYGLGEEFSKLQLKLVQIGDNFEFERPDKVPSVFEIQDQMMSDLSMNLLRIENEKLKADLAEANEAKRQADEFHERAKVRNQNLKEHIENEKERLKVELEKLIIHAKSLEEELESVKKSKEEELESMKKSKEEFAEILKKAHEAEIENMKKSREEVVEIIRKSHENELESLKKENQRLKAEGSAKAEDESTTQNSVSLEMELAIQSLKSEIDSMKIEFGKDREVLKAKIEESKEEQEEMNNMYNDRLQELTTVSDQLRGEQKLKSELQTQVAKLNEEKLSLENKLIEESEKMKVIANAMEELAKQANEDSESESGESSSQDEEEIPVEQVAVPDLCQWAWRVLDFSSQAAEPGTSEWSAQKILGAPRVKSYGDSTEAWAPFETNGGHEFITLKFKRKVYITDIRILENWNPGAVTKIEVKHDDVFETVWEETPAEKPHVLRILQGKLAETLKYPANIIKIHLDTSKVYKEWNEIAAVQLAGNLVDGEEDEISEEEVIPEEPKEEMMKIGTGKPAPKFIKKNLGTDNKPPSSPLPNKPTPQSTPVKAMTLNDSSLSNIGFGDKAFASILQNTKGILRKVVIEEKPKKVEEEDGILAAMKKRFAAVHDAEELSSTWDSKDANWDDNEWDDDDEDML